jgi:hypothetical protein
MRKVYKKLSEEQRQRGVIFASTLSKYREEMEGDTTHEVLSTDEDREAKMNRLLDDKFFNAGPWKFNIIRR